MAFDENMAGRVRKVLARRKGVAERRMFGGLAFLLNGNMCCGVMNDELVVRLGPEEGQAALKERHTREMDFTGRPMKSMVYVSAQGVKTDDALRAWVRRAVKFATSLPAK